MPTNPVDRKRFEQLFHETKSVARAMQDADARRTMNHVAWAYQLLAEHAEKRERNRKQDSDPERPRRTPTTYTAG